MCDSITSSHFFKHKIANNNETTLDNPIIVIINVIGLADFEFCSE